MFIVPRVEVHVGIHDTQSEKMEVAEAVQSAGRKTVIGLRDSVKTAEGEGCSKLGPTFFDNALRGGLRLWSAFLANLYPVANQPTTHHEPSYGRKERE